MRIGFRSRFAGWTTGGPPASRRRRSHDRIAQRPSPPGRRRSGRRDAGGPRLFAIALALLFFLAPTAALSADDLGTAQQLAWDKRFEEAEAMYRRLPDSPEKRLGLARVLLWTGRYDDAIALFDTLGDTPDAIEGRATAEYWSGDLRAAQRDFRRVADREFPRRSLAEIDAATRPSQRLLVQGAHDDQPLDALRAEVAATIHSDPLTHWTAAVGTYFLDHDRRGSRDGRYVRVEGQTKVNRLTIGGSLGALEFPDGKRLPLFGGSIRYRELTLRVERREELSAATAIPTHPWSTTTALRWDRTTPRYLAAVEANDRRYFDDNRGHALVAWGVAAVWKRKSTLWAGLSAAMRDTEHSRFNLTGTSSTFDPTPVLDRFEYQYRGEYDPYWTPDDLREARAVFAWERPFGRAHVKLHADGGYARDRGVAFGPHRGPAPFPAQVFAFPFDRTYHPWRAGVTTTIELNAHYRLEAAFERGATVDYRANTFHAAVVRRR